ncbi:hypothetical protein EDD18DRAFT_1167384 [Armillaria luteobubalina]|uniref:Uncharacterized protein n=1 Tax=Armillaria luteobubalina TaxID=153913 RepID=A0AA39UNI0_9AGAR|nr:hypothetical protein EDD18DRAFT_1167384 [Armillaria luteobubalina]
MAGIVLASLPVFFRLFSRGVRLFSLVAGRWPLKHYSRIQPQDSGSLEVLTEVRSSLCFQKTKCCRFLSVHSN